MVEPLPSSIINASNATNVNTINNAVVTPLLEEDIIAKSWENEITLETFGNWINVSAYKIECLDLAIKTYRSRLQVFILLSLILSTLSGTVSVAQFGSYSSSLKLFLNSALTISSFVVALLTGAVKTLKLQETLEEYINLKLRWVSLSAKITNEIYLPKRLRRNAEDLICENKGLFLDLLKMDIDIPSYMTVLAAKHIDKGDDIESQYYKYKDNIIKKEKEMNYGCMKFYSFFYDCCRCCYSKVLTKKIVDNRALAKTIKFSQIENASSYKRKAYQYSLSSIMLNNVKHECSELHDSKVLKPLEELPDLLAEVPDLLAELPDLLAELPDLLEEVKVLNLEEEIPIINSIRKSLKKLVHGPSPSPIPSPSEEKKKVIKDVENLGNEVLGNEVLEEKDAE